MPVSLNLNYLNTKDLYSRVITNDFFINSFYYLWTSFWYIPLLLLTVIMWQITRSSCVLPKGLHTGLVLLSILVGCELHDYWLLNNDYLFILYHAENFNNLLSNSINKYHPGLFYITSLSISTILYINYTLIIGNTLLFLPSKLVIFFRRKNHNRLALLTTTLFLGGWWALQEGSWGG